MFPFTMISTFKKPCLAAIAAAALAAGILPSQAVSILTNGNFETQNPQLGTGDKVANGFATLTGWNNTTGQPNDSGIQGAANGGQQPQSGSFFVFEQGSQPGLYQVTSTTLNAGDQLTLTWYAQNSYQTPQQQVNLISSTSPTALFANTAILASADSSTNPTFALIATYTQYTLNYTATSADAGRNVGVSIANIGPGGTYINTDNYVLNVVPEPSTWIMLLAGMGAVVLLRQRRHA